MTITNGSRKVLTNQVTYKHVYESRGFTVASHTIKNKGDKNVS